jgi:hypothetical protein
VLWVDVVGSCTDIMLAGRGDCKCRIRESKGCRRSIVTAWQGVRQVAITHGALGGLEDFGRSSVAVERSCRNNSEQPRGDARFFEHKIFIALGPQRFWNNNLDLHEQYMAQHMWRSRHRVLDTVGNSRIFSIWKRYEGYSSDFSHRFWDAGTRTANSLC